MFAPLLKGIGNWGVGQGVGRGEFTMEVHGVRRSFMERRR